MEKKEGDNKSSFMEDGFWVDTQREKRNIWQDLYTLNHLL